MESQRKGPGKKAKSSFCFLCVLWKEKQLFFIQKKNGPLGPPAVFWTLRKDMEVKVSVFVLPSTCLSPVSFLDYFLVICLHWHLSGFSPALRSWQPQGKEREGCSARVRGIVTHKAKDQCKKDKTYSQGKQMGHAGDLSHEKQTQTGTGLSTQSNRRQKPFSISLFYPVWFFWFVLSGMWFYRKQKPAAQTWG